jgi:hypothetical protein
MSIQPQQPPRRRLTLVVAAGFLALIAALAIASWDIARGRAPVTTSPLIEALLETPEERRCSRDVAAIVARHVTPGMARADARAVLERATVTAPTPWFWTPAREESVTDAPDGLHFVRVMRFTAFGNQKVIGKALIADGRVASVTATMVCPFN